jgi:hypothetical protein
MCWTALSGLLFNMARTGVLNCGAGFLLFHQPPFLVEKDLQAALNAVDVVAKLQEHKNGTTPVALATFPASADWTAAGEAR